MAVSFIASIPDRKGQSVLKRIMSDEKGRTLAWTLLVLALGTLLLPPFLTHASTNLMACRAIEESLKEQYAADSGVEYALWHLQNGMTTGQHSYTLNKKAIDVTWEQCAAGSYKITSTATSHADGSSTTIESYVSLEVVDPPQQLLSSLLASSTDATTQPGGGDPVSAASGPTARLHILTYHIYP